MRAKGPLNRLSVWLYLSWPSKFKHALNTFLICLAAEEIAELISAISITDGRFSLMGSPVSPMNGKGTLESKEPQFRREGQATVGTA
jgi:hypothetical protein